MAQELLPGTRVDHDRYGEGIVNEVHMTSYDIFFAKGGKMSISKTSDEINVMEAPDATAPSGAPSIDLGAFEELFIHVLDQYGLWQEHVPMGDKWQDGKLILEPGKEGVKGKEIPVEAFFHKIVMLRDRLRVLEQNINSHEKLSDEEKVHMQQYITRIYGSLTSFNVLFAEKEHYFKGTGK
jgi:hypothetical protein